MGDTQIQQPQPTSQPAQPAGGVPATAAAPNDQAAATADTERRKKAFAQLSQNKSWMLALGSLAPPEAGGNTPKLNLKGGDATKLQAAAYKLALKDPAGTKLAVDYLTAAGADASYATAVRTASDNARTDTEVLTALDAAVALMTVSHQDIQTAGIQVLAKLAALTDDGRGYLRAEKGAGHADALDAYIAKNFGGADDASKASKDAYGSLASAIKAPADAGGKAGAAAQKPEPLTGPEEAQAKQLLTDIKNVFAGVKPLAATADGKAAAAQKANPQQMQRLLTLITSAPPRIKDWVYAWREADGPNKGKGVLEILGGYMSPSQVEQINDNLDPVERVYKDLGDQRNGRRDPKLPKTTEYQIMHDFLAGFSGESGKPVRDRFRNDARIMQQFVAFQSAEQGKILTRMMVTGREEPDAVDKVHDACDKGDSNAAIQAIFELAAKQPADLQKLRTDLIFVHRLKDQCGKQVVYNGVKTTAYDLFLQLCGVNPNETREAGSVDKQAEVDPNKDSKPLEPGELGELEDKLYTPFASKIAKELNGYYCNDDTVLAALHDHERAAAQPHMVDLLRRGKQSPGPTLASRIQAQGVDVRLRLQKKIWAKNLQECERILGFAADQATVGVIGGQGTLATDNKVENGTGKVPLEQALRETTTESGEPLTEFIHAKAKDLANELTRWLGPRADHVRTTWNEYKAGVSEKVCADLRTKTGLPRVWPIEMLANAYLPIGGGALETKLKEGLGKDHNDVITEMGMSPTDIAARKTLADQKAVEDNSGDEKKNAAMLSQATQQAEQQQKIEQFRAPTKELFDGLSNIGRVVGDDKLKALGAKLTAGLKMGPIAATGPAPVPKAELDVSAQPGGPVHPGEAAPTDFASFYKREYGIDPRRHAVEVAKALANKERTAEKVGEMLGVQDGSLYTPPVAPDNNEVKVDETNVTLVSPGFSRDEALNRAQKIWDLIHTNGQIQLIRQQFGATQEEDRLINIAFRHLSAGIDIHFYLQQHLSQQKELGNDSQYALSVGGGGAGDADKRSITVVGAEAETEAAVERAQTGKVSLAKQLLTLSKANNMDEVYSLIESATPDQKREILANSEVMTALRQFGDDSYEWNRIYKGLTGSSDLFDRLESRAHGKHGFIGGAFEGTDEKGMNKDIADYAKQRKVAIRAEVVETIFKGKEPQDPENKKKLSEEVNRRLRVEFQSDLENPSIKALLTDELSGAELAKTEGMLNNSGEENKVASALTEGDWTEDEEKILADIKKMSPAERKRCRENPEYIAQLRKAIQTQATWRDAMTALDSTEDGSKGDNDDNFAKLEKASRSQRQDTTELMFEQDDVIEALSKLTPDEYARLKANPRLQAQVLTSLEGKPDLLAKARQMMAFNAADAGSMTGLTVGDKPDPAKGIYPKAQVERLAFMKFSAENQLTVGASRGWGVLLQAAIAVYNMKLNPKECLGEGGGGGEGGGSDKPLKPEDLKPEGGPQAGAPQAGAASPAQATPAKEPDKQAPPADANAGEAGIEDRLRHDILKDVTAQIQAATTGWGKQTADDGANKYGKDIEPAAQQTMITQAILHQKDPSDALLIQSTGHFGDDEDRIKETLKKASDEQVINEWITVVHNAPNGSASLKQKYETWKTARDKAGADPNGGKRKPQVGTPEWTALTAFKAHVLDTSDAFEDLLIKYTGGVFADDDKTKPGEKRVRDNSEWLEWRTIIRDRIPQIDRTKIATAIGAGNDTEAKGVLADHTLQDTLGQLEYDTERYQVDRGENSNYNMDRLTAGGEGLALDNSMDAYRQTVMQSVISKGPNAGEQYGQIDEDEKARIADAKSRFQSNDGAFREAKSQVATIAATVVALIITAVVTVLTAGVATGPMATILVAAITAAAASAGSNATKKAVQGTDFEFGKEGLENIARDTVMGAVTAGTTWYAGKIVNGLFAASSAAEQAAVIAQTANEGGFFLDLGKAMATNSLQTGMQGVFESGMAAFDPAMWLDGWNEGWRRGSAKARERASEIPLEMLKAAAIAAMSHSANAGLNKLKGGAGEEDPFAGKDVSKLSLAEKSQLVGSTMYNGAKEGVVLGASEVLLDEKTYRSEGAKPADMLGHVAQSSANMAQMSAGSAQAKEGHAAGQPHEGEPSALMEMTERNAATKERIEAAAKELEANGKDLNEHERELYKEVCASKGGGTGTDTTVMSVREFKQARAEMVEKAAAQYEAEADRKMTAEERAAFERWVESAPSLKEYVRRAEAGPSGAPGGPPAPAKAPTFDKPADCVAERTRAEQVLEKMKTSAEAGKESTGVVAELRPQQVEAIHQAKAMLDEMKATAKSPADRAEISDLVARLNNTSAELARALETAGGGASVETVRQALKDALDAAEKAPADKAKHMALHQLVIAGEVSGATTPAEAAAAAAAAPKKLADLKALVDEVKAARDNAARREMAAPKDTVEAKDSSKDAPAPQDQPVAKDEPKKQDAPAQDAPKQDQPVAKDEPKKQDDPVAKDEPKKDDPVAKDEPKKTDPVAKDDTKVDDPTQRAAAKATPEQINDLVAREEAQTNSQLTPAERQKLAELAKEHGVDRAREVFEQWRALEKSSMPSVADQMAADKDQHAQIEVHNHFMGNVPTEGFVDQLKAKGELKKPGQLSDYEPLLDRIIDLARTQPQLAHKYADGQIDPVSGKPVIEKRGPSGDALEQARIARDQIRILEAEYGNPATSEERRQEIQRLVEEKAKSACDKSLRASDETDFNSSYEIRDELVKSFYGAGEREQMLADAGLPPGTDPNNILLTEAAYREHFAGRPKVLEMIDNAVAAQRRLDEMSSRKEPPLSDKEKKEIPGLKKQVKAISEQMAYDAYAMDTLRRLAEDNIRYTEQSNSANKLDQRFDPEQIEWLKAKLAMQLIGEGKPELAQKVKDLGVAHVAMINTGEFGTNDPNVDTSDVQRRGRPDDKTFQNDVKQVVDQTARKDVVGVDIAGMEQLSFDKVGQQRFKYLYEELLKAAIARGEPIVLRPHVGEGAGDVTPGKHGMRDLDRQTKDGELTHYKRARENLDALITVLESVAAEHGGKLPPEVIVRFGHATHTTPEMAERMAKLGIIAEVNLQSNVETGSVDQSDHNIQGGDASRTSDFTPTSHETDPTKREAHLDDHALPTLIFNNVQIILSTDGHEVMSTNLGNEYRQALKIIEDVRAGRMSVAITGEQASRERAKGGTVDDPGHQKVVEIFYDQMSPEKKAQFDQAYEKLFKDAHKYFDERPKQNEPPSDPPGGGHEPMDAKGPSGPDKDPDPTPAADKAKDAPPPDPQKVAPWDQAAQQKDALDAARNGTATKEQREVLADELRRQVPDVKLAAAVAQGDAKAVVSIVFSDIKRVNDDLVGLPINSTMMRERDTVVKEIFERNGLTVADQDYKTTTIVSSMPPAETAAAVKKAMAEVDAAMQPKYAEMLRKGLDYWTGERQKAVAAGEKGEVDRQNADKRIAAIQKELGLVEANPDFKFKMTAGVSEIKEGQTSYADVLAAKMDSTKAAYMARGQGEADRSKTFSQEEYVGYAKETLALRGELKALTLPFYGPGEPAVPVMVGNDVNRDILRALRKGKIKTDGWTDQQKAALELLKDYFTRVNTLDYVKQFTHKEVDAQGEKNEAAQKIAAQLESDKALAPEMLDQLERILAGTRSQASTASEAQFFNRAAELKDRVVLNADIKDMGLDLFDGMADKMAGIANGKDTRKASESAADRVVLFKRRAENGFREFYQQELLPQARAKALELKRPELAEALEKEGAPLVLLGGDEMTISLNKAFEELGLVQLAVAKLNEVANARVAVTHMDPSADGRTGHIDAMDKSAAGHDMLKKFEQSARDLEHASRTLGSKQSDRALELAKQINQMYTTERGGTTILLDANGREVDVAALEQEIAELTDKDADDH